MRANYTKINFKWANFLQGGMILYVGGFYFLYRFVLVVSIFISQYAWIETPAIVTQSSISNTQEVNSKVRTSANFEYTYQVEGKTYKSRVFAATQLSLSPFEGALKFQRGDKITIFYNPRNPESAVVERRSPSFFVYFGFVVALLFLFLGTGLTFFGEMGGVAYYFQDKKAKKKILTFAAPYQNLTAEAFKEKIPEILDNLPSSIKYDLTKPLVIEGRVELADQIRLKDAVQIRLQEAVQIIVDCTQWDISKAQLLVKEGLEQKMNAYAYQGRIHYKY